MEDIDELLARLKVTADFQHHKNDPKESGAAYHLMDIFTNLDNPNIPDKLISKAQDIHDEDATKERVKSINEDFERHNKMLTDTSTDNSDRLKPIDEAKTKFKVGQIERE
jgi:hypothetical protein